MNCPRFYMDSNSEERVLPFLANFPDLEQVFFGRKMSTGKIVGFCPQHNLQRLDHDSRKAQSFIDSISQSFRGGLLNNVRVLGLRCPLSGTFFVPMIYQSAESAKELVRCFH